MVWGFFMLKINTQYSAVSDACHDTSEVLVTYLYCVEGLRRVHAELDRNDNLGSAQDSAFCKIYHFAAKLRRCF